MSPATNERKLKLVPFNPNWVTHDKLDIKAIYRRPRYAVNDLDETVLEVDDVTGLPKYDLTTPLPVRHHNKWTGRGFIYVTLADRESLRAAAAAGSIDGDPRQYDQHQTGGPWNYKLYLRNEAEESKQRLLELASTVQRFGSAAVEEIRRQSDPAFELPPYMRGLEKGAKITLPA